MTYGCGDENCRSCYQAFDWAVIDLDTDGVIDRWVDGDAAREAVADGYYGDPAGYEVIHLPDPNPLGDDAPD